MQIKNINQFWLINLLTVNDGLWPGVRTRKKPGFWIVFGFQNFRIIRFGFGFVFQVLRILDFGLLFGTEKSEIKTRI